MAEEPPAPPRAVRTLRLTDTVFPLVTVCLRDQQVFIERTGEVHPLSSISSIVRCEPSSVFIVNGAARLLAHLHDQFAHREDWQFRLTPDWREIRSIDGQSNSRQIQGTVVNYFGFRGPAKKRGRYHHPVDPNHFVRKSIHELVEGDAPAVVKLLRWGQDVRDWCQQHGIKMKPSNGGIAGQLLRHPAFFPEDRRKVPRATNARARPTLPGNHYRLYADDRTAYQAYYLDMQNAHHNIAARLAFPDPDSLLAHGRFRVTDGTDGTDPHNRPWLRNGSGGYRQVIEHGHGLLYVHLSIPKIPDTRFPPPYLEVPGNRMAWIYTNEIPTIRELGGVIDWITAGWFSFDTAPGLNRYAKWAMREMKEATAARKQWLKSTLLATYGVLAARPRVQEFAYRYAKGGVPREYPAGSAMLPALARIGSSERELPTANVIYRGMIEAEQRQMSLRMARDLHDQGHHVLGVYADSVFVESTGQLPLLVPPWRIQDELDRLIFLSPTAFTSAQLTKLPGIPREGMDRFRRLERVRSFRRDP